MKVMICFNPLSLCRFTLWERALVTHGIRGWVDPQPVWKRRNLLL
jgi:hypothetical protein